MHHISRPVPGWRITRRHLLSGGCAWSHVGARVLQGSTKGLEHPQMSPVSIPLTAPYAQLVEWLIRHHKVPCIDTHGGTVMSSTRVKAYVNSSKKIDIKVFLRGTSRHPPCQRSMLCIFPTLKKSRSFTDHCLAACCLCLAGHPRVLLVC